MVIHSTLVRRLRVTYMLGCHLLLQKYLMRLDGAVSLNNISAGFVCKNNQTYSQKCVCYLRNLKFVGFSLGTCAIACQSLFFQRSILLFKYPGYCTYSPGTNTVAKFTTKAGNPLWMYIHIFTSHCTDSKLHRHCTARTLYSADSKLHRHYTVKTQNYTYIILHIHRNAHILYSTYSDLHRHYNVQTLTAQTLYCKYFIPTTDFEMHRHYTAQTLRSTDRTDRH
jgi:hypothetical protein